MSLTAQQLMVLAGEISAMQNIINQTQSMCNQLKTAGTILYNDPNLLQQFPNDGPGARAWLVSTNTILTNFMAALTNLPSLNS